MIFKIALLSVAYAHDSTKCMINGVADATCCSEKRLGSCDDNHEISWLSTTCATDTYNFECAVPNSHDSSKCLEYSGYDDDCCAARKTAMCSDSYNMIW